MPAPPLSVADFAAQENCPPPAFGAHAKGFVAAIPLYAPLFRDPLDAEQLKVVKEAFSGLEGCRRWRPRLAVTAARALGGEKEKKGKTKKTSSMRGVVPTFS